MKYKDLKAYHAYYITSVLFFLSCFFFKDMVFFPLGCAMLCWGWVSQLKETGRISRPGAGSASSDETQK